MIGIHKGIALHPGAARSVVSGVKTVEILPRPPYGSMCPPGVKEMVGCGLEPFEPVAILDVPANAVVAVTSVPAVFPAEQVSFDDLHDPSGWRIVGGRLIVSVSQKDLGVYEPGRWACPLTPVKRLDPPVPGPGSPGQGIFLLPDTVCQLVESQTCGVTARTVWEHLRTGNDLASIASRMPAWALPWLQEVAADLVGSFEHAMTEIRGLAAAGETGPGPYQSHVRDLLADDAVRVRQRVWAQLRPCPERPAL